MTTPPSITHLIERYGLPDDCAEAGDRTNLERAESARLALDAYVRDCCHDGSTGAAGDYDPCNLGDLIGDLLHLVIADGLAPEEGWPEDFLSSGRMHFEAEVGLGYGE